jgi:homoserine dehydrogenase
MPHVNLALIGFGNVGQALAQLLLRKRYDLKNQYDISFAVTAISTGTHGSAIDPGGIDLQQAISRIRSKAPLDELSTQPVPKDGLSLIKNCQADVLFENTPVDYKSGQPALDHLRTALELGMHAITANKGPVVHGFKELSTLATTKGRKFYFESTVMDGAPIFSLFRETLPAANLIGFRGILNSTTNLILSRMETGEDFAEAVAYAQSIGIAETDPSGDVDGWDAAIKVAALVTVLMGISLKPADVDRQGIRGITVGNIEQAKQTGKRWKLVCSARHAGDRLTASVKPEMISPDSPLYTVDGTTSVVQFETDVLGLLSVIENDPGPETTAYGLLADFINAVAPRQ